jgi:hypothetical protein
MNGFKQVITSSDKGKRDLLNTEIPYKSSQPGKTAKWFLGSGTGINHPSDISCIDNFEPG